jgi:hypothetical protein
MIFWQRAIATRITVACFTVICFAPALTIAGGKAGPEIGTILIAEQAAATPGMGKPVDMMMDKPVRKGERLVTGSAGRIHIRFSDESEIAIGPGADLTLDDLIYAPAESTENRFEVSVVSGAFRYLSGKIARLNAPMVSLKTPLATIGIRGTHVLAIVDENYAGCIVLLETPGAEGKPSSITVTANGKSVTIDKPGWGTEVTGPRTPPAPPRTWPKERIRKMLEMAGSNPDLVK